MDAGKMLWTILGFGIALSVVGAGAYFYTTEGAVEDDPVDDTVQETRGVYLLRADGISGEVSYGDYDDWMLLQSFAAPGISTMGGATGDTRQRGDVVVEDIECVKEIDKSSPKIAEAVCKGKTIPLVEVQFCWMMDDDLIPVMSFEFKTVIINRYVCASPGSGILDKMDIQTGGGGGEDSPTHGGNLTVLYDGPMWSSARPLESLSFQFEEFTMTYTQFDSEYQTKGNVETSWKRVYSDI